MKAGDHAVTMSRGSCLYHLASATRQRPSHGIPRNATTTHSTDARPPQVRLHAARAVSRPSFWTETPERPRLSNANKFVTERGPHAPWHHEPRKGRAPTTQPQWHHTSDGQLPPLPRAFHLRRRLLRLRLNSANKFRKYAGPAPRGKTNPAKAAPQRPSLKAPNYRRTTTTNTARMHLQKVGCFA